MLRQLRLKLRLWRVSRRCRKLMEEIWWREDFLLGVQIAMSDAQGSLAGPPDLVDKLLSSLDEELMRCIEEKHRLLDQLNPNSFSHEPALTVYKDK